MHGLMANGALIRLRTTQFTTDNNENASNRRCVAYNCYTLLTLTFVYNNEKKY